MSKTIFTPTTDLTKANLFPFLWKIGKDGEERVIAFLIYICLKVEIIGVKTICALLIITMI